MMTNQYIADREGWRQYRKIKKNYTIRVFDSKSDSWMSDLKTVSPKKALLVE